MGRRTRQPTRPDDVYAVQDDLRGRRAMSDLEHDRVVVALNEAAADAGLEQSLPYRRPERSIAASVRG